MRIPHSVIATMCVYIYMYVCMFLFVHAGSVHFSSLKDILAQLSSSVVDVDSDEDEHMENQAT